MDDLLPFRCVSWLSLSLLALAGAVSAQDKATPADPTPDYLPLLMTESGRNFEDVHILQLDPEGPVFRHNRGIAKIPYTEIKAKTRQLLGYPKTDSKAASAKPATPAKGQAAVADRAGPNGAAVSFIPVRITTRWYAFAPCPPRPVLTPYCHNQPAWPFEDPFRPFAAVDLMVNAGLVPHPSHGGPRWIW